MSARWWIVGVWAAVLATVLHWGFKLFVPAPSLPNEVRSEEEVAGAAAPGDLARLLGVEAVPPADVEPPPADTRFQLIGVISPASAQAAHEGLALIAVDGSPPRVFRVGAVVEGRNLLQAVDARSARLGPRGGASRLVLTLASSAPAVRGAIPRPGSATPLQAMAAGQRVAALSEQERFHQRQQLQFQEEERENQRP